MKTVQSCFALASKRTVCVEIRERLVMLNTLSGALQYVAQTGQRSDVNRYLQTSTRGQKWQQIEHP
jgi:hypothetical protein